MDLKYYLIQNIIFIFICLTLFLDFSEVINIIYSFRDTDSIIYKIQSCSYEKYSKVLKENTQYFNKELGLMENEINENINGVISLRSKSNSIQKVSDINIKFDNNNKLRNQKEFQNLTVNDIIHMNISEKYCLMK